MKKILLLTGSELRHQYIRYMLYKHPMIKIVCAILEGEEQSLENRTNFAHDVHGILRKHIIDRKINEEKHFNGIAEIHHPVKFIKKGDINSDFISGIVKNLDIDYVVCYGCSILTGFWFDIFHNKIINMHLGLSPYYRGSGTNFWAMADNNFSCVGTTFMYMNKGIDTGKIIIQKRAEIKEQDSPHDIGNRLIKESGEFLPNLLCTLDDISHNVIKPQFNTLRRFCSRKDFNVEIVTNFYKNFNKNRDAYLKNEKYLQESFPICEIKEK